VYGTVGFDVNVTDLYHGTTCPLDQICAEGLDPRISVHGHFGRGIYFRFVTNKDSDCIVYLNLTLLLFGHFLNLI